MVSSLTNEAGVAKFSKPMAQKLGAEVGGVATGIVM